MVDEHTLEAFWRHCEDPEQLRHCAGDKATDRKLRLFSCACCRQIWHRVGEPVRRVVEVAERYADGQATWEELDTASDDIFIPHTPAAAFAFAAAPDKTAQVADFAAWEVAESIAATVVSGGVARGDPEWRAAVAVERRWQADLFRELLGNPFRPVVVDPTWLTWNGGSAVRLAEVIYQDRTFDRLPELAEALEEAGCRDADLLQHCRQPGPHVRGCWVVDLLLGKK